jgi:mono/diheme cytochrome c family protein
MCRIVLIYALLAAATVTAEDWQRKAVEMYPQLGVAGSAFNTRFVALYRERLKTAPAFFQNPQWPLLLAQECAGQLPVHATRPASIAELRARLAIKPQEPPPPPAAPSAPAPRKPAEEPTPPELADGRKLYVEKCGRCHEAYAAGPVEETTWIRWLYKWRGRAQLSDNEYDQLVNYGKLAREARAARLKK